MMRYAFDYGGVWSGPGVFGAIVCLIVLVDLVLVGIWLWKQINK